MAKTDIFIRSNRKSTQNRAQEKKKTKKLKYLLKCLKNQAAPLWEKMFLQKSQRNKQSHDGI